jgi:hypothetical protein
VYARACAPGQKRHCVHGFAGKDREARMAFEHVRSGFVRRSTHDHEHGQFIGDVSHAISQSALDLAKRSALVDDGALTPDVSF